MWVSGMLNDAAPDGRSRRNSRHGRHAGEPSGSIADQSRTMVERSYDVGSEREMGS
jgi:hypothetical protein